MNRALLVDVTTYGFFHAGVEPLRREVLKRTWSLLPGATFFGALQAAMIRLDGLHGPGPTALLKGLTEARLRFTPILPDPHAQINDAASYCQQAHLHFLQEQGELTSTVATLGYQTTPHAPISRRNGQIEGSLLYAMEAHRSQQHYRGWIFCSKDLESSIRRAIGLLPFIPLGGKGKFATAEAEICKSIDTQQLKQELLKKLNALPGSVTVELAMPMAYQGSHSALVDKAEQVALRPPRRYRVWRTGHYPSVTQQTEQHAYGPELDDADLPMAWLGGSGYRRGQTSESVVALPERSRFIFSRDHSAAIADAFVAGLGRADWSCLGWGQLFVHLDETKSKERKP